MTRSPDLDAVARRVILFEAPEDALRFPNRFLTYLMTYGTLEEILVARRYFTDDDFRAALDDPAPGIFDMRSWHYWHLVYGRDPVPPLPTRKIP
jgi:hypothetical protein